jgi:hypothetical protein
MASKPTARPRWGTDVSNDTAPTSGQQDTGYTVDQVPTSGVANWLQRRVGEWIDYFADMIWQDSPEAIGFATTVFTDWTEADPFSLGDVVRVPHRGFANDDTGAGNIYLCTAAGTSGSGAGGTAGPPAGTGTGIVDGTCQWKYLGHDGYRHGDQELVGVGPVAFRGADSSLASGHTSYNAGAGRVDWIGGGGVTGAQLDLLPGDVLTTVRWMYDRNGTGSMQFGLARKMNNPAATVEVIVTELDVTTGTGETVGTSTHNHTIKAGYNYWLYATGSSDGQKLTGCTPRFTRPAP